MKNASWKSTLTVSRTFFSEQFPIVLMSSQRYQKDLYSQVPLRIYLATHSSIRSKRGIAIEGLWWANVESTTIHKLRVSSSNCSSEVPHSGHESSSRSPSKGSLSMVPSKTLSKDRVEWLCNSLGFEPPRLSTLLVHVELSTLPGRLKSTSRVSRLLVDSMDTDVNNNKKSFIT